MRSGSMALFFFFSFCDYRIKSKRVSLHIVTHACTLTFIYIDNIQIRSSFDCILSFVTKQIGLCSSLPMATATDETTETPTRKLITDWMFLEMYNHRGETKRKVYASIAHAKGVMKVAGSDLKLNEDTRKWVLGYFASMGVTQEVLDLIKKFKPNTEDGCVPYHSNSGLEHAKVGQLWLFYDGFRAASAGGELNPKKIEAIYATAKRMLIDEAVIKQVQQIFEEDEELRRKQISVLFPDGVSRAAEAYRKAE